MSTQHRRDFLEFLINIAFIGSSFLTATFSFLRLFNPGNVRAKERHKRVLLKDIKIDKYGRIVMKHQKNGNLNTAYDNHVHQIYDSPDLICPCPKPPEPPWPVPDLICPCPKPPEPPSKS